MTTPPPEGFDPDGSAITMTVTDETVQEAVQNFRNGVVDEDVVRELLRLVASTTESLALAQVAFKLADWPGAQETGQLPVHEVIAWLRERAMVSYDRSHQIQQAYNSSLLVAAVTAVAETFRSKR